MITRNYFLTAMAAVSLSMSACGKKKEITGPYPSESNKGQVEKTKEPVAQIPNPEPVKPTDPKKPAEPPVSKPTEPPVSKPPEPPVVKPPERDPKTGESQDDKGKNNPPAVEPVTGNPVPAKPGPSTPPLRPTEPDLVAKLDGNQNPVPTVAESLQLADPILTKAKMIFESLPAAEQRAQIDAAAKIVAVYFEKELSKNLLAVVVQESDGVKLYNFAFTADDARLKSIEQSQIGLSTGKQDLSGQVKCLDVDGSCEVILAKINFSKEQNDPAVTIAVRNIEARVHFQFPAQSGSDLAYATLQTFVMNSVNNVNTDNKISQVRWKSFEVLMGRRAVTLEVIGVNHERFAMGSSLSRLRSDLVSGVSVFGYSATKNAGASIANLLDQVEVRSTNFSNTVNFDLTMKTANYFGPIEILLQRPDKKLR